MKKVMVVVVALMLGIGLATPGRAEVHHRIGGGVHYWQTLDNIDADNVDEEGFAYLVSYQLRPASLIKFGIDVEFAEDEFGGAGDPVYAPQIYAIIGGGIYAGIGIGGYYTDGEFAEDPFYNLRAGIDFALLPLIYIDINVNYRVQEWDDIKNVDEEIDTDVITLGAAVRIQI